MPQFPIHRSVDIASSLPQEELARRVSAYVQRLGKSHGDTSRSAGEGEIGSRFAYRMFGATRWGISRLPIRLSWTADRTAAGSTLALEMTSNEGTALFATSYHEHGFNVRFAEITKDLQAELAGPK